MESNPFTIEGYEGFIIFGVYFATMQVLRFPRKPKLLLVIFLALVVLASSIAGREFMLRRLLHKVSMRVAGQGYSLAYTKASIKGISTFAAEKIGLNQPGGNNFIILDTFRLRLKPIPLLFGHIRISRMDCKGMSINYLFDRTDTIDAATKEPQPPGRSLSGLFGNLSDISLSDFLDRQMNRFFSFLPGQMKINHLHGVFHSKTGRDSLFIREMALKNGKISATAVIAHPGGHTYLDVAATVRSDIRLLGFSISARNGDTLASACLKDLLGLEVSFDTLAFQVQVIHQDNRLLRIRGSHTINRLFIHSDLLAAEPVMVERFHSDFAWLVGAHFVEADSSTNVSVNRIKLHPLLRIDLDKGPMVQISFRPVEWDAADFFPSLPRGMFSSLVGMKTTGKLRFALHAAIDLENPDSLDFTASLEGKGFMIKEYGTDDYRILNEAFTHRVYENGILQKSFVVGVDNRDFVPIGSISPFLKSAVLTSEDGRFYLHRGFNPAAFRESIAANLREMRFVRGGSTISMQLVKNVFLSRNKTFARKIEEALIVWLIENHRLVSKERMFEVYLNIIEWGPSVFGIHQASWFYFNKDPHELNLQESIFLASIVPHPKWFAYTFDSGGRTRPFFAAYLDRMKALMAGKGWATVSDTTGVHADIRLLGPASKYLSRGDSLPEDPLMLREMELMVPLNIGRIQVAAGEE